MDIWDIWDSCMLSYYISSLFEQFLFTYIIIQSLNFKQDFEMGIGTSDTNKLTIDQKLQFLQTKPIKQCKYHRKQCNMYCAIPNCQKCPFVCPDCIRQNIHEHPEGIYNFTEFLKAVVNLIQIKKTQQNQLLQASLVKNNVDYAAMYKEQVKILEHIDYMHREITIIINEFREKLQSNIDRLSRKLNKNFQPKTSTYINFFRNPNILACKISSQPDDRFLLDLKYQLRSMKRKSPIFSEQQQLAQMKLQLSNVKNKIRQTLNTNNISGFMKKNSNSFLNFSSSLKKTFMLSNDCPTQICSIGSNMNITTNKELFSVQIMSKESKKLFSQSLSSLTTKKQGDQFIGMSNQLKVIYYDGRNFNQLPLLTKISSINILKSKRRLYGLLGEDQGIFNIIDLQQNKSTYHYRCGDQPITHIQICQTNSTICCAGRKTPIYMFKYRSKFTNIEDLAELDFEFILQMNYSILPQGQLQLMRINNNQLYLFGPSKNIVIFDLMLNTELIRTEYTKKCGNFLQAQFITINDTDYMLSLNENDDVLNIWQIDKIKRTIKVQQFLKEKSQRPILSFACTKNQLWVIRDNQKNIDVFSLTFQ